MNWHRIRTLLGKEVRRQLANRGGIALAALLVVAALLVTFFSNDGGQDGALTGRVEACYIDYWREDAWLRHLRDHVPAELKRQIKFRDVNRLATTGNELLYPPGTGAIQIRPVGADAKIWVWQPSPNSLLAYEVWFWRESARFFQRQAAESYASSLWTKTSLKTPNGDGQLQEERSQLKGGLDMRSSITAALVLFALFFFCVYLLPSLMCEERERGVLLAQALSPASPLEILVAKFLFYPAAGIGLAAVLAGIAKPEVLSTPFFWLVLVVAAIGSLGIGLTIACIAKTQRAASMGALCYMLVIALFLFICQQGSIPGLPYFALEYHCPRMLHAVLAKEVHWFHWVNLGAAAVLAFGWSLAALILFQKRGWQ